jgi:hypothetical protein
MKTTRNLKIKKVTNFTAEYLAELMVAGITVNIHLGEL